MWSWLKIWRLLQGTWSPQKSSKTHAASVLWFYHVSKSLYLPLLWQRKKILEHPMGLFMAWASSTCFFLFCFLGFVFAHISLVLTGPHPTARGKDFRFPEGGLECVYRNIWNDVRNSGTSRGPKMELESQWAISLMYIHTWMKYELLDPANHKLPHPSAVLRMGLISLDLNLAAGIVTHRI